ncbi:MAG: hypothetical protein GDA42_03660 [Ekhidna sp.]|nr:hypothetical protein [Ekhidna sp.]
MDIQTRKIAFVQEFLKLQNEKAISRLESVLKTEKQEEFQPMSIEEFNKRIDTSMEDAKNGKLIEASELKAKIDKWA